MGVLVGRDPDHLARTAAEVRERGRVANTVGPFGPVVRRAIRAEGVGAAAQRGGRLLDDLEGGPHMRPVRTPDFSEFRAAAIRAGY